MKRNIVWLAVLAIVILASSAIGTMAADGVFIRYRGDVSPNDADIIMYEATDGIWKVSDLLLSDTTIDTDKDWGGYTISNVDLDISASDIDLFGNSSITNDYYMAGNGSDSNNGLTTSTPKATLQATVNMVPDYYANNYTIHVASGNYAENDVQIIGKYAIGGCSLRIQGYQNSVDNQFTHEVLHSGTAKSVGTDNFPGSLPAGAPYIEAESDFNIETAGYWGTHLLHLTGGTGYNANFDVLNWYMIDCDRGEKTSDYIYPIGNWIDNPDTDTDYEIIAMDECSFTDQAGAAPILTIKDCMNVSVWNINFVGVSGGAGLLVRVLNSTIKKYASVREYINGIYFGATADDFDDIWCGILFSGVPENKWGIGVQQSIWDIRAWHGLGTTGTHGYGAMWITYGSRYNLTSGLAEYYNTNIYIGPSQGFIQGLNSRFAEFGTPTWGNNLYIEGAWLDDCQGILINAAESHGIRLSHANMHGMNNITIAFNGGDGVYITKMGVLATSGADCVSVNNTGWGVSAHGLSLFVDIAGWGLTGNGSGAHTETLGSEYDS